MRYLVHGEYLPFEGDTETYGEHTVTLYASDDLDDAIHNGGELCANLGALVDDERDDYQAIIKGLQEKGVGYVETYSNNRMNGYFHIWDTEHPKVKKLKKIESEIEINTQGD